MPGTFIKNVGWMGLTEIIIRISRLFVVVVLGRLLSPHDYGLAAIVLTVNDFVDVLTRNGIGAKLIQAPQHVVGRLSRTAYWLNWIVSGCLVLLQCGAGLIASWVYHDNQLLLPICALSCVYFLLPFSQVKAALIRRENRLHISAISVSLQVILNAILTIIFAFMGWGMWAIVAPKILVAPIWVVVIYLNHSWNAPKEFTLQDWKEIVNFGRSVLGVEMLKTLRQNLDYLLIGPFLGVDLLGVYYFAFNAGLGLSLSIINALTKSLYPHLCEQPDELKTRFIQAFKTIALIIIPMVILQSATAPIYIPIVFGSQWATAVPLAILICLSAIPRPFAQAASQMLWAKDCANKDFLFNVGFTMCFALALLVGMPFGLVGVATAVVLVHWIVLPLFTYGAIRHVFSA